MTKLGKSVLKPYKPSKRSQEQFEEELRKAQTKREEQDGQKIASEQLHESMPEDKPKEEKINPLVGRVIAVDKGTEKPSESKGTEAIDDQSESKDTETDNQSAHTDQSTSSDSETEQHQEPSTSDTEQTEENVENGDKQKKGDN